MDAAAGGVPLALGGYTALGLVLAALFVGAAFPHLGATWPAEDDASTLTT